MTVTPSVKPPVPLQLTDIEARVLGTLMEKARTVPDSYPLTLNALLLFVAIGLNLAGVFEVGLLLTRLGNRDPLATGARPRAPPCLGYGVSANRARAACRSRGCARRWS